MIFCKVENKHSFNIFSKFLKIKSSYFDDLRNFCKRQIFVKLKITSVSTFGKLGRTDRVDYRGATKKFWKQKVLILMNWETFVKDFFFVKLIFSNKCDGHTDIQSGL